MQGPAAEIERVIVNSRIELHRVTGGTPEDPAEQGNERDGGPPHAKRFGQSVDWERGVCIDLARAGVSRALGGGVQLGRVKKFRNHSVEVRVHGVRSSFPVTSLRIS